MRAITPFICSRQRVLNRRTVRRPTPESSPDRRRGAGEPGHYAAPRRRPLSPPTQESPPPHLLDSGACPACGSSIEFRMTWVWLVSTSSQRKLRSRRGGRADSKPGEGASVPPTPGFWVKPRMTPPRPLDSGTCPSEGRSRLNGRPAVRCGIGRYVCRCCTALCDDSHAAVRQVVHEATSGL